MSLIKQVNTELNEFSQEIYDSCISITENCKHFLQEEMDAVCETAEEFLDQLAADAQAGKLDPNDNAVKGKFAILTALDLLRYPQGRQNSGVNSLQKYLNVINSIGKETTNNQTELNLMQNLEKMQSADGTGGMDARTNLINIYNSNREAFVKEINKIKASYASIANEIKQKMAQGGQQQGAQQPTQQQGGQSTTQQSQPATQATPTPAAKTPTPPPTPAA